MLAPLMIEKFFLAFIPVFVAIDPIGLVAIFLGLGTSASPEQRKRQAVLGIFTALGIAIGFIFLGKIIFAALGITVADFQVAGGLILLGLAGRELLSLGSQDRGGGNEFGVVPLGMPSDRRASAADCAAYFGRYGRSRIYTGLAGVKSRAGRDRVLECRPFHPLDRPTGIARRVQNSRASSCRDRRQFDSAWLAGNRLIRLSIF